MGIRVNFDPQCKALAMNRAPVRVLSGAWAATVLLLLAAAPAAAQTFGYDESHILYAQDTSAVEPESYEDLWARGEYRKAIAACEAELKETRSFFNAKRANLAKLYALVGEVDRAIEILTEVVQFEGQPTYYLDLADYYDYRGQPLYRDRALDDAMRASQRQQWTYGGYWNRDANLAARGRLLALTGNNPKNVLSTFYDNVIDQLIDYNYTVGPELYNAAGDLAYEYDGYDIAAEYYQKGLEADPNDQNAMAGLAACFWKSNDPRAEEMINQLLTKNPNHFDANAILVERLLETAKTEKAREIIERMLGINPVHHQFRSLLAAAQFLDDDLEAMQATIDAVLEYNPILSGLYRTIGKFASRQYRFKEGAEFQELALALDPTDHEARALYTLDLMRLGDETRGRAELEAAFAADPYDVQLYNLLQLMDTLETFEVVRRGAFVLKLPKNEAPVMAEPALDMLDDALERYEAKYKVELEKPILIEMFDRHDDFMVRSVGLPGSVGHLGICFGKVVTMDAPSVRPKGSSNWRAVLWHEFVHVVTLQKTANRMPRWLSEGISVYEEAAYSPAFFNRREPGYKAIIDESGYPGVSELDALFTAPPSGEYLMFGYFISAEFIYFYADEYGFDAIVETLNAIREGADAVPSLLDAAGVSEAELDEAFHAYLDERMEPYQYLPRMTHEQAPTANPLENIGLKIDQFVGDNPEGKFPRTMKAALAAVEAQDWDRAEPLLREAYDLYPDYDGADAPLRMLAHLYREQGQTEQLHEIYEKMVFWTPTELDAALALLDTYAKEKDWRATLETADWALGINPYDPNLYRVSVAALEGLDRPQDTLDHYPVLLHLDPAQAMTYRLKEARTLADLNRGDEAKHRIVRLLEEAPHFWDAQQLLLDLVDASADEEASGEAVSE